MMDVTRAWHWFRMYIKLIHWVNEFCLFCFDVFCCDFSMYQEVQTDEI